MKIALAVFAAVLLAPPSARAQQVEPTRLAAQGVTNGAAVRVFAAGSSFDWMTARVVNVSSDTLTIAPQGNGRPRALAWSQVQGVQTAEPDRAASALVSGLAGAGLMALLPTRDGASKGLAVGVAGGTGLLLGAIAPYIVHWRPVTLR